MFNWTYFWLWFGSGIVAGWIGHKTDETVARGIMFISFLAAAIWWSQFGFVWAAISLLEFIVGSFVYGVIASVLNYD